MPRNEDGEFELILGNRQLLSVFFIVVILFGVFFAMGYIVGRSSAPVVATDTPARTDPPPPVIDSAVPPGESKSAPPPAESAPERPITTAPQQPVERASPPVETAAKAEPPKSVKEPAKADAKPSRGTGEPTSGQIYLQLSATQRAEAEVMVDVLGKKGFKAIAAVVPDKPGLYRVLVGPVAEGALNKTRADLQGAGFPGDKAIRKSF